MQDLSERQRILSEIEELKLKQDLNRQERRRLQKLEKKLYGDSSVGSKRFDIVKKYPKNVYLAPGTYDGVIILTKLGKREILDSYDEKKISNFITEK